MTSLSLLASTRRTLPIRYLSDGRSKEHTTTANSISANYDLIDSILFVPKKEQLTTISSAVHPPPNHKRYPNSTSRTTHRYIATDLDFLQTKQHYYHYYYPIIKTDKMGRGDVDHVKVHYKGKDEDFVVFIDSTEDYQKWLNDKSVPLAQVVSSFKVFTTNR
jgi:hypothetical protein